jgi:F-type H+-transporting ATPase subunit b
VLINWFTVIAQIINFLILMVLLKIFLYDKIVKAMDEREKKIADRLEDADRKKQEAEEREKSLQEEKRRLEEKRKDMLEEAEHEAGERRKKMIEDARREVDHRQAEWHEALRREKKNFLDNLRRMIAERTFSLAGRLLQDLADAELQERVADVFIKRIKDMDEDEKKQAAKAIQESGGRIALQSSFDMDETGKHKITAALREELGEELEVGYETDPELLLGVNLKFKGRKIAWSLEYYLEDIMKHAGRLLEEQAHKKQDEQSAQTEERQPERQEQTSDVV